MAKKLTDNNIYIIVYSCILVIIVAFLLAFVSSALKPTQDVNVALDKKKQILAALNIRDLSDQESAAKYAEVVKSEEAINKDGDILYLCDVNGKQVSVVPVRGMGLWGPIWGYIAVNSDGNTVYGAYFNHESETAGLGAEIKDNVKWQEQFIGKTIYAADGTVALKVLKKSEVKDPKTQCDAVTGATLTSNGVSDMLQDCFAKYKKSLTPALPQGKGDE